MAFPATTPCDVFAAIDPKLFKSCFLTWVEDLRDGAPEIIAIDGKTSRRGHDRGKGRKPLQMVSAWATRQRIVLGEEATEEKSNEITAIPRLLKSLDLQGTVVTIDAMGTQTRIAQTIRDGRGHYVLSLKENWSATFAEITLLFDRPPPGLAFDTSQTVDGCSGRITTRRHTVCHETAWLTSDRRYPGKPRFPDLAMIGRVESEVKRDGRIQRETRYYVCSTPLSAAMFGRVVRGHGVSRTACTGTWMSSSAKTSRGCAAATLPRTWRSSATPPQPAIRSQTDHQFQEPSQESRGECRLSGKRPAANRVIVQAIRLRTAPAPISLRAHCAICRPAVSQGSAMSRAAVMFAPLYLPPW